MKIGWIISGILFIVFIILRFLLAWKDGQEQRRKQRLIENSIGMCQTTGGQEYQSDVMEVFHTSAGRLGVLADGIGKENTGRISAQTAVLEFQQLYCQYRTLKNPIYLLKRGFSRANLAIQRTIGERRGGASVAAAFMDEEYLHYALAGDIKIALFRGGELIPLSEGHTVRTLAKAAWISGKITKQETLGAMKAERLWNYVGMDGFKEVEIVDKPIRLKKRDSVVLMTKGIYKVLPWMQIEDIMKQKNSLSCEKANQIVMAAEKLSIENQDNGSVIIMEAVE